MVNTGKIINHILLPRELRTEAQIWSINNCEGLKVADETFTWSGSEIPYIGRYGGHLWKVFCSGLDARVVIILSTGFWLAKAYSKLIMLRDPNRYKTMQ